MMRNSSHVAFALTLVLTSTSAFAAKPSDKKVCIEASEKAQQLRADGELTASREQLLTCARDACPGVVRKDCSRWLGEVDDALPSVVLAARDHLGHDVPATKVTVDDAPFADRLDGKAQTLDPGSHVFKFEAEGHPVVRETVLVREGEKNRTVTVTFPAPPGAEKPAPVVAPVRAVPTAAWIATGVGVVALGSFVGFGLAGRSQASDLRATCAPSCADDDVSSVRTKLLVADVSLGVSLVSFGIGAWIFLSPDKEQPKQAMRVEVSPLAGGGALRLTGAF